MSILTPFFHLYKKIKGEPFSIEQFNDNMDIIDTEMHRPPLTVNGIEPDSTTRDLELQVVPLADNLTSDEAQINTGTFVIRTSGGEASISNGSAWLSNIKGNMVKTGYVSESLNMTVTPIDPDSPSAITADIDRDDFVDAVSNSGTYTFTYTTAWSADPAEYGITVNGTPEAGDQIVVVYVKENRGTITTANPTSFVSTGWNLYNHSAGYARVVKYSDDYGFMIDGTYTALSFSETVSGERISITPVNGYFTVPSDGYVFVTGGDSTSTEIWMTWSDWTEEANSGTFEAYTQTQIDLTGIMVNFPYGLMKIDNVYDEIDLNTQRAYSRIERIAYTEENLATVIASGVAYDTDTGYIYAVRVAPVAYVINIDGEYTVSDHGEEMFIGTSVPLTVSALYGNDLKGKLRRDVLTISSQTLTPAQKEQVQINLGVGVRKTLSSPISLSQLTEGDYLCPSAMVAECTNLPAGLPTTNGFNIIVREYATSNAKQYELYSFARNGLYIGSGFGTGNISWTPIFRSNIFDDTTGNNVSALLLGKYNLVKSQGLGTYLIAGGWKSHQYGLSIVSIYDDNAMNAVVVFHGVTNSYIASIRDGAVAGIREFTTTLLT